MEGVELSIIFMNIFKNTNVLVTGGTGFVGAHLVEGLIKQKANIVTTYISENPKSYFRSKKLNQYTSTVNIDVCDYEKLFDIITKYKIEYIYHLAAQALVDVAYDNPKRTLYTNILGTINICESARLYSKVKGVIIASSDKAYGKLSQAKYKETDPLAGDHPYEVSKSAADLIANSYIQTYKVPIVITRFGNIYGQGDLNFSRIIPGIMEALINHQTLLLRSNGKFVRDYLYVKDVVAGYLTLAEKIDISRGQAFNFGSNETLTVLELINRIEKILHKKIDFKIINTAHNEIPYQSLDYSKISKLLGWKTKWNLKNTIKSIYKFYRQYYEM